MVQNEILWWKKTLGLAIAVLTALLGIIAVTFGLLIYFPGVGTNYPVALLFGLVGIPFLASAVFSRYCKSQDNLDLKYDMAEDA